MIEWLQRRLAKKIWRVMLKYYEHYGEDLENSMIPHYIITMDYMKKVSERSSKWNRG
jgi:hypothetical protein